MYFVLVVTWIWSDNLQYVAYSITIFYLILAISIPLHLIYRLIMSIGTTALIQLFKFYPTVMKSQTFETTPSNHSLEELSLLQWPTGCSTGLMASESWQKSITKVKTAISITSYTRTLQDLFLSASGNYLFLFNHLYFNYCNVYVHYKCTLLNCYKNCLCVASLSQNQLWQSKFCKIVETFYWITVWICLPPNPFQCQ